mmetsp:Transcript_11240/g.45715  ORF Transcript_11240/g.45715 Transcript_11240/m.45715 type:complete len:215 (+) Transcript_11240:232-876(+)
MALPSSCSISRRCCSRSTSWHQSPSSSSASCTLSLPLGGIWGSFTSSSSSLAHTLRRSLEWPVGSCLVLTLTLTLHLRTFPTCPWRCPSRGTLFSTLQCASPTSSSTACRITDAISPRWSARRPCSKRSSCSSSPQLLSWRGTWPWTPSAALAAAYGSTTAKTVSISAFQPSTSSAGSSLQDSSLEPTCWWSTSSLLVSARIRYGPTTECCLSS